ncbi:MAG: hypothetical protein M1826_003734 [Phylliscum demangeonii]|nr:MAG: hypothetical protein M1826_003734 [Phylliscum demangeonii]
MPLHFTAAHSSGITKSKARPLKRVSSGPSRARLSRIRPGDDDERLPDIGLVVRLGPDVNLHDAPQALRYAQETMFTEMPQRAPGMNSTRIAQVLNYRASLPRLVTLAHLHALLSTPSATDREIARLEREAVVRQLVLAGRSNAGRGGVGAMVVRLDDLERSVNRCSALTADIKTKFLHLLRDHPTSRALPAGTGLTSDETLALVHAGYLTAAGTAHVDSTNSLAFLSRPSASSSGTLASLATAGSQQASGSLAAIGGEGAVHNAGGGGAGRRFHPAPRLAAPASTSGGVLSTLEFSMPSTGVYLRLLTSARSHLVSLLSKSAHREAPLSLLRERWNGGIASDHASDRREGGPAGQRRDVLPGRTRKWKEFYGLAFEWVLAECCGSGMVELFETGTVGKGVRAR